MDRSLNGDDFRLYDRWQREDHPERYPQTTTTIDSLPGWFRQALREQAVQLGCESLFPELFPPAAPGAALDVAA